jgi:hypothetical protein
MRFAALPFSPRTVLRPRDNAIGAVGTHRICAAGCERAKLTHWRSKPDSNLYGAFPVKQLFWFVAGSLFGAGKPFFVPSLAIRFAERAEGVKGPKR